MAVIQIRYCTVCNKETSFINNKCVECENKKNEDEIERWQSLTLEEKIEELKIKLDSLIISGNMKF